MKIILLVEYTIYYYGYVKNHYRLIANDLSKRKELDADPIAIQQIEFFGELKKLDDDDGAKSIFISTILEKVKQARLKFSQGSVVDGKLSRRES